MNFDRVKEMIYREIDEISEQDQLTIECVEALGELVDILKDISEIDAMENYDNGGYSNNGSYSYRGGRNMNMRYYDGSSYNNGYSYGGGSYRNSYRRNNGYSRDDSKHYMISELERMMNEAQSENDKMEIKKLVEKMKNN